MSVVPKFSHAVTRDDVLARIRSDRSETFPRYARDFMRRGYKRALPLRSSVLLCLRALRARTRHFHFGRNLWGCFNTLKLYIDPRSVNSPVPAWRNYPQRLPPLQRWI